MSMPATDHASDALSPLDGRYAAKLKAVREIFSEAAFMRERVRVECAWLLALAAGPAAAALASLPASARDWARRCALETRGATAAQLEWVHFAATSEDINNLSYALMLKRARDSVLVPMLAALGKVIDALALRHADAGMLARTHGQAATPTTVGKELANVAARLERQRKGIAQLEILGKMNGAVGNFNAHVAALPHVDWPELSARFIRSLGLEPNTHTTQIEPHDWIAEYCHALARANTVLIDFTRDMWAYISLGYCR